MNREDIIKLAQEAGLIRAGEHYTEPARWGITEITDFYQRAVAAERRRIIAANAPEIERINAYIKELEEAVVIGREKVAAWMMRQGYATGHGDSIEDLLKELEWQIKEKQEPMTFVCSTGSCRFTLTQTGVGIGERGMQAYEEAKKRGWVGISDERLMDTDLLRKCLDALEYEAQRGNDDAYRELRDALKERLK